MAPEFINNKVNEEDIIVYPSSDMYSFGKTLLAFLLLVEIS